MISFCNLTTINLKQFILARFTNVTDNINGGMKGGPLVLFNDNGQAMLIVPLDNYMSASMCHDGKPGGHLAWGIMGGVNEIPANHVVRTGLFYSESINEVSSFVNVSIVTR